MITRAIVRRAAAWVIVAAAAAYLYLTITRNWRQLGDFDWQIDPILLAGSIVAHVAVLAWGVYLWRMVLRLLGAPSIGYPALLRIWSASNLTRYIPGAVWQFMTAAHMSRGRGLPAVVALSSMLIHVGFSLLAAVAVAAVTLPIGPALGLAGSAWVRGAVVAVALLAVHPAVVNAALRLVPRALHREVLAWRGSWRDGLVVFGLASASWAAYGIGYSLFVAALAPIPLSAVVPLTAVNALSFTAGYLAVLAPGGIGVRESAMTVLLSPILPAGVAAVLAIAARLWSVAAELILTAAGVLAARAR